MKKKRYQEIARRLVEASYGDETFAVECIECALDAAKTARARTRLKRLRRALLAQSFHVVGGWS